MSLRKRKKVQAMLRENMRMIHQMRLFSEPFDLTVQHKKTVEVRLYDEKRRKISQGDLIVFSKLPECILTTTVKVNGLRFFRSFEALYKFYPFSRFGREDKSFDWMMENTYSVYSKPGEIQYGVLAIEMEWLKTE